jgi:hypothetical protein
VPLEPDDLDVAGREGGALGGQIFARDEAGARRLVRGEGGGGGEAEEQHVRRQVLKIR